MRKPAKKRREISYTGWRPTPKWIIVFGKGTSLATQRMSRRVASLEEGRQIAIEYLKRGWEWAEIKERL